MAENDDQQQMHPAIRGLKTVCRCNNIKYRTIERAIRDGAHTLTQVATRTTATTGHCGGSCTPDVQDMLAELAPQCGDRLKPVLTSGTGWWVRQK
jgi:NAD(P)H-nitrite reductase large subunit